MYCVFLPGPSDVKQRFIGVGPSPRCARSGRRPSVIPRAVEGSALHPPPLVRRERPTRRMAQVGRVEPLRSDGGGDALWRVSSEPGPCTTVSCVERSVPEPARPAERHFDRRLLSVARLAHSRAAHAARGVDRPRRIRPSRAHGRAPAPGEPVFAGVPWACGVEMGECGHVIVSTSRCVRSCSRECQKREIAPPMIARLTLPSGLGQRTRQQRGASTREHRDATPRASSVVRTR